MYLHLIYGEKKFKARMIQKLSNRAIFQSTNQKKYNAKFENFTLNWKDIYSLFIAYRIVMHGFDIKSHKF